MRNIQKIGVQIALMLMGIILAAGSAFCSNSAELIALADKIKNENPGIQLTVGTDKKEYQIGEKVAFEFTADKDCYLALIDIGTSGRTLILFPNKWHTENKVEKGKIYKIPAEAADFAYKVEGPVGTERIKIIASLKPFLQDVQSLQQEVRVPLEQSSGQGGTFLSMKNPEMVLKDIHFLVAGVDPREWATVDLQFKVTAAVSPEATPTPTPAAAQSATSQPRPETSQSGQAQPQMSPAQSDQPAPAPQPAPQPEKK